MDLRNLIQILEVSDLCLNKAMALLSNNEILDESVINDICYYYMILYDSKKSAEEIIMNFEEQEDVDDSILLLRSLYNNILECAEIENNLPAYISLASH